MKLFIASDLHGSAYYTRIMLERYAESGADKLVLLGDILYHGPRNDLPRDYAPKEVAKMLNEYASDIIAVRGNCGKRTIYLSHGHRVEPKLHENDVYLTGHTHIPHDFMNNGARYLNPGSVSIPKNFTKHSAMLYSDGRFEWMDIENGEMYTL